MENSKSVAIVFICHDNTTINECLEKTNNCYVLFVGDNDIDAELRMNSRVTVVRDLQNNIESEKKLLTFTAWYAIIKNNLFLEYQYICLFEYDVIIEPTFETTLRSMTQNATNDVIYFMWVDFCFMPDISEDVFDEFLRSKNVEEPNKYKVTSWFCTTNHCILRNILDDFVDWYYPNCLTIIKAKDHKRLSWYHERMFHVYTNLNNLVAVHKGGVQHLFKNSHGIFQE